MIKILIGNIKREIKCIAIDLLEMFQRSDTKEIVMTVFAFILGIIVTLTYGSLTL
jgi:hypothetical protein